MEELQKILFLTLIFVLFFLFATGGFLTLGDSSPNVLLVFAVLTAFFALCRESFVALLLFQIIIAWIEIPFWFLSFLILIGVSILVRIVRSRLTGNLFADFMMAIVIVTVAHYAIVAYQFVSWGFIALMGKEILLNLILGAVLWFLMRSFIIRYGKTRS